MLGSKGLTPTVMSSTKNTKTEYAHQKCTVKKTVKLGHLTTDLINECIGILEKIFLLTFPISNVTGLKSEILCKGFCRRV